MNHAAQPSKSTNNTETGAGDHDAAVRFCTVREQERGEIVERRAALLGPGCQEDGLLGLAISGGGIRSATFSLGIIQRLAQSDILKHIDYISTVSGGGFIGSWLFSWIRWSQVGELQKFPSLDTVPTRSRREAFKKAFGGVCNRLNPEVPQPEAPEITFLRQYSNYLTPRVSVFNADTWVAAAIWSRNTLLNLAILVAAFGLVVLLARLFGQYADAHFWQPSPSEYGPAVFSAALLLPMVVLICRNLWSISKIALRKDPPPSDEQRREASDTWVIWFCIFPLLSAISYSFWLDRADWLIVESGLWNGVRANFYILSIAYFMLQVCSGTYKCHMGKAEKPAVGQKQGADKPTWKKRLLGIVKRLFTKAKDLLTKLKHLLTKPKHLLTKARHLITGRPNHLFAIGMHIVCPAAAGFVTAALLRAIGYVFETRHGKPDEPWFVLTWGPPLVLVVFAIGVIAHIGLMGRDLPEASREWLGRLRAWLMIFSFFWLIIFGVAIYGPWLLAYIGVKSTTAIAGLGSGWILTTAAGLLAGKSGKTSGKDEETAKSGERSSVFEILARIGPYLFMAGFLIAVAFGVHAILVHDLEAYAAMPAASQTEKYNLQVQNDNIQLSHQTTPIRDDGFQWLLNRYWSHLNATEGWVSDKDERWLLSGLYLLLIVLVLAGGLLAWRVDINQFSLHNFYKDRLVRCYLGASRQQIRKPNPFTGFDDFDDCPLDKFTHQNRYCGPYPIINAALNVTSGGKLQYQERQAQSYIFTPFYTGYSAERVVDEMRLSDSTEDWHARAYRPTEHTGGGIKVGMAVATSGAAVNPNMGYHTSTAVSFLLTVFNVRLGWWLGNTLSTNTPPSFFARAALRLASVLGIPLRASFSKSGPPFGLLYSFRELLGLANAEGSYVNLSDGGHFDNMGIYELVRRGCRYIICCDGEQDSGPTFGGIGNAIRKCRTDFGVEIDLPVGRLRKLDGFSRVHCAVGRIKYKHDTKDADDTHDTKDGYIVYLKSSLTGDEPTDVLAYHSDHPDFPQQSTGDQWFDESQFESYRSLGYHVAGKAFSSGNRGDLDKGTRQKFFNDLYQVWYPPSAAVDKASAAHSEIYARIMETVRTDRTLESLDPALFEKFDSAQWTHDSGHLCNGLIQLMERVFYELGLEDQEAWEHPYVQGWLDIFAHWRQQEPFNRAWKSTELSYPERFREFYNNRLMEYSKRP